jgi:hypothetical protein
MTYGLIANLKKGRGTRDEGQGTRDKEEIIQEGLPIGRKGMAKSPPPAPASGGHRSGKINYRDSAEFIIFLFEIMLGINMFSVR